MNSRHQTPESVRLGLQEKLMLCLPEKSPPANLSGQIWQKVRRKKATVRQLGTSYFRGNLKMRALFDLEEEEE